VSRFGQKKLQLLHRGRLRLHHRLGTSQRRQRLVPLARGQQAGQIGAEVMALGK
jgi:hypothetical protein